LIWEVTNNMGFNNCYLPEYDELIKYYNSVTLEVFVKRFRKYDCWTGSSESMNFLENKVKEYYELQQIQVVDKGENKQTT